MLDLKLLKSNDHREMCVVINYLIVCIACLSLSSFASDDSVSFQLHSAKDAKIGVTQKELPYSLRNATDPTVVIYDPIDKTFMDYRLSDTSTSNQYRCRISELETQNTFLCSSLVLKNSKENIDQIFATTDLKTFYKLDPSMIDDHSTLEKYAGGQIRWNNPFIDKNKLLDIAAVSLYTFSALWIVNYFQHTSTKALPSLTQFSAVMIIELPFLLRKRSYFMNIIPAITQSKDSTNSEISNEK